MMIVLFFLTPAMFVALLLVLMLIKDPKFYGLMFGLMLVGAYPIGWLMINGHFGDGVSLCIAVGAAITIIMQKYDKRRKAKAAPKPSNSNSQEWWNQQ